MRKSNKQYNPRRSNQNKLNTVKERKYTSIEEI